MDGCAHAVSSTGYEKKGGLATKDIKMEKPLDAFMESLSSTATISQDIPLQHLSQVLHFLHRVGISDRVPDHCNSKDFYTELVHGILKPLHIVPGRVTCLVSVKPAVANILGGFHGGAVAAVAEVMSIACATTVIGEETKLFLGELSISYLSAAPKNAEVIVDGFVVKTDTNLSVIAVEFKLKKTGKLAYTARATFYHTLAVKL